MPEHGHRSERRYAVRQFAWVRIVGQNATAIATITENVSNRGFLLRSDLPVALNSKIEVTLLLPSGPNLKGAGQVVRLEQSRAGETFLFAVMCDRPLEIDKCMI